MEEQINNLTQQVKTLLDKVTNLENNSVLKSDFTEQIKPLTTEISTIRKEMISGKDIKIKVKTIQEKKLNFTPKIQIKYLALNPK
jgi:hypothetical protein